MPCLTCGTPLLVGHKFNSLYCPNCLDLGVVDPENVQEQIDQTRQIVSEDQAMTMLNEYDKNHLILLLIDELNRISHSFYDQFDSELPIRKFAYTSYLLKLVYERDDFGDEQFEYQEDNLPETIGLIYDLIDKVYRKLDQVEDGFVYAVKPPVEPHNPKPFVGEHIFFESEYRYCFLRCLDSLAGGSKEGIEFFYRAHEEARSFEKTDVDNIDSLQEFISTFFEIIVTMAFMLSTDKTLNKIYHKSLPDSVDAFDLKGFLDCIDSQFTEEGIAHIDETGTLPVAAEEGVNQCGENVFGDDWEAVRESLLVSENNVDAHPFLFKIIREHVITQDAGRPPVTKDEPVILYPRYYNQLIRFQLFPLLENGDSPSGQDLLDKECKSRGEQFEYNLYEFLKDDGYECYYSSWFTKSDQHEIDLIVVNQSDEELWFIECKFLLPETHMRTASGVIRLNQKFDSKVYKEDTEHYDAESGKPFPEKVETWLNEKPGDSFLSHLDRDCEERVEQQFAEKWTDFDVRMFVVSNVVPSYIEKQNVEFLTDVEFIEMLEDEVEIYTPKS
jgi:hypothetical protein